MFLCGLNSKSTTKKMLEKNMKLEDIQEITGLSQKELENLVKNSN